VEGHQPTGLAGSEPDRREAGEPVEVAVFSGLGQVARDRSRKVPVFVGPWPGLVLRRIDCIIISPDFSITCSLARLSQGPAGLRELAGRRSRGLPRMLTAGGRRRRVLMVLVFLGGLPLPILAIALGVYVLARGLFLQEPASPLLTSQLLLFMTAVLVVGA